MMRAKFIDGSILKHVITMSATNAIGGVSRIMKSNSFFTCSKRVSIFSVSSNSAGFGGIGPAGITNKF